MAHGQMTRMLAGGLLVVTTAAAAGPAGATYIDVVLADNPEYYWNFDEASGNALNLGGQGSGGGMNDLVPGISSSRVAGGTSGGGFSLGSAAQFDGVGTDTWLSGTMTDAGFSQYVIEFWFQNSTTGAEYLFEHGFNSNAPSVISGFNPNIEAFHSSSRTGADGPNVSDGNWHHVVIGFDPTVGHTFYVDGTFHSNQTELITSWGAGLQFALGDAVAGGAAFSGQIDELAVYSTDSNGLAALTAQVAGHYNAVPEPGAIALMGMGGLLVLRRRL